VLWEQQKERPLERLGVDGKTGLKRIVKKYDGKAWTGFSWLRQAQLAGCCEHGDELPGFIQCGKFVGCLRNC
jgi:hypothetical protein